MYPPVETPTSPDDQNMVILDGIKNIPTPEQIPRMPHNPFKKSSNTLRNNIDVRNDNEIKRTSLMLEPTSILDEAELIYRNKRLSLNDKDLILAMSKRNNAYLPSDDDHLDNVDYNPTSVTSAGQDENQNYYDDPEIDNKNGNQRIMDYGFVGDTTTARKNDRNSMTTCDNEPGGGGKGEHGSVERRAASASGSSCSSSELENGGGDKQNSNSTVSSGSTSNDDERRLLFHNHDGDSIDNHAANAVEAMDMLSPDEGPLARRYAEIAQFKVNSTASSTTATANCNKW